LLCGSLQHSSWPAPTGPGAGPAGGPGARAQAGAPRARRWPSRRSTRCCRTRALACAARRSRPGRCPTMSWSTRPPARPRRAAAAAAAAAAWAAAAWRRPPAARTSGRAMRCWGLRARPRPGSPVRPCAVLIPAPVVTGARCHNLALFCCVGPTKAVPRCDCRARCRALRLDRPFPCWWVLRRAPRAA